MTDPQVIIEAKFESDKHLTVCSSKSVQLYNLQPMTSKFVNNGGPFIHAAYSSEYLFAVANSDTPPYIPSFVIIFQISTGAFVRSIEFTADIIGLEATSSYLFVSLTSSIQVVDIETFHLISTLERSCKIGNLVATDSYVAYCDDEKPGVVVICSVPGFSVLRQIQCHKDPIAMMANSNDGKILITASNVGTLVRMFSIEEGEKINELRRGYRQSVIISASSNESLTCCVSPTTLHIFLPDRQHITVPINVHPIICKALGLSVAVVDTDGILSVYKVDGINGTAKVLTQHRLFSAVLSENSRKRRITI
ncbi:hypothetical protein TRFO_24656 [Tritrichomonas foetus]|uniref:Uncharacterized protein n=1 Tax=Tritrichomonas foetus TaxID=1144522 RepID=A0A1J4K6Z9_9EUKA|nr:hypothetical protein TRFO_24656 [Tritrichomonas foetus]|eukprot:OHT07249.1 hypothetical protein TRFO_24656 [Tritrichomonas foetus]